ncbi:hypothetical protein H8K47_14545 [Undibacterium sp. CY7W]|uniref:Uncharacterized protein n=1 Tax=Undibacterium rugosum TaxID=2762291 RepID=A0A923IAK8_9BURK|nr:hypothetical protein [Undibacterium rugosum]MBC3936583.1 hypothetical protein [Undibacterium rugosum]
MIAAESRAINFLSRIGTFALFTLLYVLSTSLVYAQAVKVSLTFNPDSKSVEARFQLSNAVDTLRFVGNGEIRLKTWTPLHGARLNEDGTALILPKEQNWVSVKLNPFERDGLMDRVYSPVILFGDGRAAQIYSEYLLPRQGGVINLTTPGVVLGHAVAQGKTAWGANDAATYIVAGQTDTTEKNDYSITLDKKLPAWIARTLNENLAALMNLYSKKFGSQPKKKPWIVVSFDPNTPNKNAVFRGDTNPGMVRLNFMGRLWEQENTAQINQLSSFLAHELFHLWNAQQWKIQREEPIWLFEGGADAAAQDALRTLGVINAEQYKNERTKSLIACSLAEGETLASKLNGRTHYTCGAAIFYLAAAMNSTTSNSTGPLDVWASIFTSSKTKTYSTTDFLRVAANSARHSPTTTSAYQASQLKDLINSTLPWREALIRDQGMFHLHETQQGDDPNIVVARVLLDKLVIDRVDNDCQGSTSISYRNQSYQIDALRSCRRIQSGVTLTHLGNFSMYENAQQAWAYARDQCTKGADLHFSGKNDVSLDLPCTQMPALPQGLFVFNSEH